MYVPPVKIKLTLFEMMVIENELKRCVQLVLTANPSQTIQLQVVLMAEYAPVWLRQSQGFKLDPGRYRKQKICKMPLSVARVLWHRLQFNKPTTENLAVLGMLDQQITNRSQFLKFSKDLFDASI